MEDEELTEEMELAVELLDDSLELDWLDCDELLEMPDEDLEDSDINPEDEELD